MSLCPVPGTGRDGTLFPGDTPGQGTLFRGTGRDAGHILQGHGDMSRPAVSLIKNIAIFNFSD